MAQNVDEIIDRRRLRRKLTFWRAASLVVLAAFLIALFSASGLGERLTKKGSDHIARLEITGLITNDRPMLELIAELKKKKHVKAVILDISSPGGSTVGGETIYDAIRDLAKEKPVATSVGTLAASAGYMIACASDHIVSHRSSMVGSIGVLVQYGDVSGLLDKLGVKVDAVKSSPLKAEPSPFHPATEEAKQMLGRVVDDSYEWFIDLVAKRRNFGQAKAHELANGAIFTGAQGLKNGLVDEIGDEETAKQWLVDERGISKDLKIVEWKPDRSDGISNPVSLTALARFFGIDTQAFNNYKLWETIERRLFLDGLMSLMQIEFPSSEGELRQ
ncbi:MAG: signal peptide peptidase SppA [Salaquimonas sp.]|jgi:protease-4|nr:signal peptide peptidase SppA [Salaquimonas sp.]